MEQVLAFFSSDYMPHGHCYLWLPSILWVNVISDFLIAIAYFSIPIILVLVIKARKDIKFKGIFMLFAAFILMCGITHLFAIYTIWHGSYGWHGISKFITAIVSVATASVLIKHRKDLVKIPTAHQLEVALEKAESANLAKREFLACMSHEIRTPINGVMGMLSLALKNETNHEQIKKLNIAQKSAESLLCVINDIIDFSMVEAGKLELDKMVFDPATMLSDTLKTFAFENLNNRVEMLLDASGIDKDLIKGDPNRIRQVINNLVNNAVKFTPEGEILITASLDTSNEGQTFFTCSVKDTGIGIPREKQDLLFTPFTQADSTTTRSYGGTGLGLAICWQLVQLMGGEIKLNSQEGKGSEFSFTIPVQLSTSSIQDQDKFSLEAFYQQDHSHNSVMLISDNKTAANLYSAYLSKAKYAFITCTSIDQVKQISPMMAASLDYILLDADFDKDNNFKRLADFFAQYPQKRKIWLLQQIAEKKTLPFGLEVTGAIYKPISPFDLFSAIATTKHHSAAQIRPTEAPQEYPLNVLIAEDNSINQEVIEGMLEKRVEKIAIVGNGDELIRMLKHSAQPGIRKFDIVFMDCQMPVMDGYQATKKIRAGEAGEYYKDITIVALTANAMDGDKERCLVAGMNDYLTKPIVQDVILALIDDVYQRLMANAIKHHLDNNGKT